jgi:formylglycine-generating enzyme required for sulfatase activity
MKQKFLNFTLAIMLLFCFHANGNNLLISNVDLAGKNTSDKYILIKFDISWENSWRTSTAVPYNWDAAWIFVKYRVSGSEWSHAILSATDADHNAPVGSTIDAANDGVGVFMYRSFDGTGSNNWTNAQLRWNYGANGISDDATNVEVIVLGIEMVYVPEGPFYAGDHVASSASFKQGSNDKDPWYIYSENAINVTDGLGSGTGIGPNNAEYYYVAIGSPNEDTTGASFIIPAQFPKGYRAFYCMKYEITQGQYTEFLNMLNRPQQLPRVSSNISLDVITNIYVMGNSSSIRYRNSIVCPSSGNGTLNPIVFSTSTPDVACNFLKWTDGIAYSDWAGLRPMSELEYEKACRGPVAPVKREFAWGEETIANTAYTLSNEGADNEGITSNYSTAIANAFYVSTYGSTSGPVRVGIFAANSSNTGRITSGAGYYGIMELTGNLWEGTITMGNAKGRTFDGSTGNGMLNIDGETDMAYWSGNLIAGSGMRGGGWMSGLIRMHCSSRGHASYPIIARININGFRCARWQ